MDYDAYIRIMKINGLYMQRYWENLTFQRIHIIDQQALDDDLKTTGEINTDKSSLLVNDPVILRKLKSSIYELKIYHSHTIQDNIELKEKAMTLIQILKNEYHLK